MALREINLVPAERLHKKHLFRRLFFWAGCLAFCLSLILVFYLYQVQVVLPKRRPVTTIEDIHKQLGTTLNDIKETQQEIQRLSLQESFLKNLTRIQPFSRILLKVSETMNTRTWLTKLAVDAENEEAEALSVLKFYGYSLSNDDLGNFLTQLSAEPIFYNVGLKFAKETQIPRSNQDPNVFIKVIKFRIDCNLSNS